MTNVMTKQTKPSQPSNLPLKELLQSQSYMDDQKTSELGAIPGRWGWQDAIVRVEFCDGGEWTHASFLQGCILSEVAISPHCRLAVKASANFHWSEVYSCLFSWNLHSIAWTLSDSVNSAKLCHLLRNKYRNTILLTKDIYQMLILQDTVPSLEGPQ